MAKGVKKIGWAQGQINGVIVGEKPTYVDPMSIAMVIPPNKRVYFKVTEWFPETTAEDKKRELTWMQLSSDRKHILQQMTIPGSKVYGVLIEKKHCGPESIYVEASWSGKSDNKNLTGVYVLGSCPPLIISSKWSKQKDGNTIKNQKKTDTISYGDIVYLNLTTEGLNGKKLIVDIYNRQHYRDDKLIQVYSDVKVTNGEINLKIGNTSQWMRKVNNIQNVEEFYIKVKDPSTGKYIKDKLGDSLHAIYLNVKGILASNTVEKSDNVTVTRVSKPDVNAARYEPCKFTEIKITETEKKEQKIEPSSPITVFKEGQKLDNPTIPKDHIERRILFEFDSANISTEGVQTLNNVLKFLLEHKHSTINLSGYACVIGKMEYNKGLSQRRADAVKQFLADGKLDTTRIIAIGKGEVNPTDNKRGADNIKYKNEKEYKEARCVYLSFDFYGHDAKTIIYETIAPSIAHKNLTIDVSDYLTSQCFRDKDKHTQTIRVVSPDIVEIKKEAHSLPLPIHSDTSWWNIAPLQYFWPKWNLMPGKKLDSAILYYVHVHSCRYYSKKDNPITLIKVYPDVRWTLEFRWSHKYPFAYAYGNKLHPHDIKTGREIVIGSEIDRGWSENEGEMGQFFNLSLKAEWNRGTGFPQKFEFGGKFGERIAKTLSLFNKIKSMTKKVANSPLAKGKVMFEIKSPVIAVSAQWYLQRAKSESLEVATIIAIGVDAKPLVEAEFTINLFKLFIESAGNAVCPGAGSIITWVLDKLKNNAGIHFLIIFAGGIYVNGKVTINTSYPKETQGEIKTTGKVQVTVEFKAWAGAEIGYLGVDGVIKADVNASITGGAKIGADKDGIFASPIAEFGGIRATFVAVGTVKFGIFKRTFTYEGEAILVQPDEIKFNKHYI